MKILVCGSRSWTHSDAIFAQLTDYDPTTTEVIHGGARGADKLAGKVANSLGIKVIEYPANWTRYGKAAGFIRNNEMLAQKPDLVLAFWDGKSKGTEHTINAARELDIPTRVVIHT